tara:strand:+ start:586 stop:1629 length:1044 start_codon:yes stop_codon:yes gene_type:complete
MTNKTLLYWLFQFVGWGFILFIGFINDYQTSNFNIIRALQDGLIILLLGIGTTHLYRNFILRKNWLSLKVIQVIPRIITGSIVVGLVLLICTQIIVLVIDNIPIYKLLNPIQRIENLTGQFITVFIWSVLYFAYHFFEKSRNQEISNLQLEAAKQKAELSNLKSQMNPHFMFNSLNNIRALIDENPEVAKKSINELSNLLRGSFNSNRSNLIPFREELKLVEDYLSLEKIRFEDRLKITIEISKDALSFLVPPMLIQTLVENGIKHGISKIKDGGEIKLSAKLDVDFLHIVIINDGVYSPIQQNNSGTGIANSKKRIELLYSSKSSLEISNKDKKVHTFIKLHNLTN